MSDLQEFLDRLPVQAIGAKEPTKPKPKARKTRDVTKGAKFSTREEWLVKAIAMVRPLFDEIGAGDYPTVRVSCGWPKGGRKAIGQCWPSARSGDKAVEMFISPALQDPLEVLGVLVHELIHAIDNCVNGHKGPFRKMAKSLGLEGKMTATTLGDKIAGELRLMLGNLGPYPHAKLSTVNVNKQSTRMLKVGCGGCGCVVRMTRKWLDEVGAPTCACGLEMEEVS